MVIWTCFQLESYFMQYYTCYCVGFGSQVKGEKSVILNNANFSFEKGKLYTILGPSGSGKTTTLTLLGGLEEPREGSVTFEGKDLKSIGYSNYRKSKMGIVFQAYNLIPYFNAVENVCTAMEISKNKIKNKKETAIELLAALGFNKTIAERSIYKLSGGEQQRVAIARALAKDPEVILADEPTGNLDVETARRIKDVFKKLATEKGKCVIVVTHSEEFAQLECYVI